MKSIHESQSSFLVKIVSLDKLKQKEDDMEIEIAQ